MNMADSTDRSGPLTGIRVIDAGTVIAAPMTGGLLADFGANVVKIEEPHAGDPIRQYPPACNGQSLLSKVTNRNKQSLGLDLRAPDGRDIFLKLVQKSDVAILNYRPGTIRKWKLDYDHLAEVNPGIVVLYLTGFGSSGPYSDRPAFARIAESFGGLTHITGSADKPVFSGYAVADGLGGVYGAFSIMLALYHRQVTGRGQMVDLALYEPVMRMIEDMMIVHDVTGQVRGRHGNANPSVAPNNMYRTADRKWLVLPASTPSMYARLSEALGMPELVTDPRFETNALRVENRELLEHKLDGAVAGYQSRDLLRLLHEHDVAACLVNDASDIDADPHVWERESLIKVWDENLARQVTMPGVFPRLSDSPGRVVHPGRECGQDTRRILKDRLGMRDEEIAALGEAGVIRIS